MNGRVEVYLENESILIPRGKDIKPPAYISQLVDDYVLLYVDTEDPEIVSHLPGKTSMRRGGNRVENLTFRYRPDSRTEIIQEFGTLIKKLHSPKDDNTTRSSNRGAARTSPLPSGVEESGIFEEWWEFTNPELDFLSGTDQLHPIILKDVSGEVPNLSELVRRALLKQIAEGDTQLRLKIDNFETAAKFVKYIVEHGYETSIAVYRNGDDRSLRETEVVLVPGYSDANFDTVDDATRAALQRSIEEVRQNWQEELAKGGMEKIQALIESDTVSSYAKLEDLENIYRSLVDDANRSFRSDTGQEVVSYYEKKVDADTHLSRGEKREVRNSLRERLQEEYNKLEKEVMTELTEELQRYIDQVDARSPKEKFDTFRQIEEILEVDQSRKIDAGEYSGPVRSFARSWKDIVAPRGPGEEIVDEVRTRIKEPLDESLKEQREIVVNKSTDEFEDKITSVWVHQELRDSRRLHVLRLAKRSVEDEFVPEEFDRYSDYKRVDDLVNRLRQLAAQKGIDMRTADQIRDRLSETLDNKIQRKTEHIQKEYLDELSGTIEEISESEITPGEKAERLEKIGELLQSSDPSQSVQYRSTEVQNIQSTLTTLKDDPGLDKNSKDEVRKQALEHIEKSEQKVKQQLEVQTSEKYLQDFSDVLKEMQREWQHQPEIINSTLNTMQDLVESPDSRYLDAEYQNDNNKYVREVSKVLSDHFRDHKINDDQRAELLEEIREVRPSQLQPPDSGEGSNGIFSRIPIQRSGRVGIAVVAIFIGGVVVGALFVSFSPIGSSSADQADLEVTSPDALSIDGETVVVRGSTSSSWVRLRLDHTERQSVQMIDVKADEDGSFEREFADLPAGTYILTVSTNSTMQNDTQTQRMFRYFGGLDDPITLTSPEPGQVIEDREVEISLESSADQLDLVLYTSDGQRSVTERVTEIQSESTFPIEVPEPGTYILRVSVPGLRDDEYTARRVFTVETPIIEISQIDTNEPVTAGEQIEIGAIVGNGGNVAGSVNLTLMSELFTASEQLQLEPGGEERAEFTFETGQNDSGTHVVTLQTEDARVEKRITIDSNETSTDESATLEIEPVESQTRVNRTEPLNLSVTVRNTGGTEAMREVTAEHPALGLDNETVNTGPGENTTVRLQLSSNVEPDEYEITITVGSQEATRDVVIESQGVPSREASRHSLSEPHSSSATSALPVQG